MFIILEILVMVIVASVLIYGVPKTFRDYRDDMRLMRKAISEGRENIFDNED